MTQETYAQPPADAEPMDGPDDADLERDDSSGEHWVAVQRELRYLRQRHEARTIFDRERAAATEVPPFDADMLGDILARPQDAPFRVADLIPADAGTLLVAQRKTGKTTGFLNLARCLITGDDFLGRFAVEKITGRIAFLNFEVSAATVARWADEHGIPHDRMFLVNLRGRRNPLGNDIDRQALAAKLRDKEVESVFVDPFGRAYTGTSQNDPGEVGSFLADLDRFARGDVGARDLVLSTHAGWDGERTRGSTALEDWADVIITMVRDKDDATSRYIRAEGRDVLLDEDQLLFDERSRTLTLAGAGSRRAAGKQRQVEALLTPTLELLRDNPPHQSGNQLDAGLKSLIASGDLDAAHSKGDGARAAQILERRGMVGSKQGPRNARLFFLITSPTSLNLPKGTEATSPTSLLRGRSQQGSEDHPTSPDQEIA